MRAAGDGLPVSVFRPGMIVGDSASGEIKTFNTLYFPLRLYLAGRLPVMPAGRAQRVNLVPVDYVAEAVVRLTFMPEAAGLNFHLAAPYAALPRADELVEFVREWARDSLGLRLRRPLFLPLPLPRGRYSPDAPPTQRRRRACRAADPAALLQRTPGVPARQRRPAAGSLSARLARVSAPPAGLRGRRGLHAPHGAHRTRADPAPPGGQSRPITYHDISGGRTITRTGREVRQDVLARDRGAEALGIKAGDRVAIVGTNSTRYLALDVAIGMVGAVSVPLYYTSPPAEIEHILAASGARLSSGLPPDAGAAGGGTRGSARRLVLPRSGGRRAPRQVMSWEAFLALRPRARSTAPDGAGGLRRPGHAALYLGHDRPAQGGDVPARAPALDGREHGLAAALAGPHPAGRLPLLPAPEPRRRRDPGRVFRPTTSRRRSTSTSSKISGKRRTHLPGQADDLLLRAARLRAGLGGAGGEPARRSTSGCADGL